MNYIPYTYLIKFKHTGQVYYGTSYANKNKIAHPEQLWVSYFTSSEDIHNLIKQHGKEAFEFEVRKTFSSADQAVLWEHKVLSKFDAKNNDNWLNKQNGNKDFKNLKHSAETKLKISKKNKGQISNRKGKPLSDDHKRKISKSNKGKLLSDTHKLNLSKAKTGKTLSDDHKRKISERHIGRVLTEETKRKISNAHKGKSRPKLTEEHKKKIAESSIGRIQSTETKEKISKSKEGKYKGIPWSAARREAYNKKRGNK
jgi:hypothetical protein